MTEISNPFQALYLKLENIEKLLLANPNTQPTDEEYLTLKKAAELLGKTENALRIMVHKNQINYLKKQGKIYFKRADIYHYLESGRQNKTSIDSTQFLAERRKSA
jgi:hypothetical protein